MGCDIHGVWQARNGGEWVDVDGAYTHDRHYQLFAVLAGVRNNGEIEPIAQGRGLPTDFLMIDREYHPVDDDHGNAWMGDHSHTWLSGEEMLAWRVNAPTIQRSGIIARAQYATWKKGTRPEGAWSGELFGSDIRTIDEIDMPTEEGWVRDALDTEWTHIRVRWPENLGESLAYFFDEVKRLVELHGEIRFVCGFDN